MSKYTTVIHIQSQQLRVALAGPAITPSGGGLTPTQLEKFNGIETGATKNQTDEWFLERMNRDVGMLTLPEIGVTGTTVSVGEALANLCIDAEFTLGGQASAIEVPAAVLELPQTEQVFYIVAVREDAETVEYRVSETMPSLVCSNKATVARVLAHQNGSVSLLLLANRAVGLAPRLERLLVQKQGLDVLSGLSLSGAGRTITVASGLVHYGVSQFAVPAASGQYALFINGEPEINDLIENWNYQGETGLVEMNNHRYVVTWVWVEAGSNQIYATLSDQYRTAAEAQDAKPTPLPAQFVEQSVFLGGIIFKKGEGEPTGYIGRHINGVRSLLTSHNNLADVGGTGNLHVDQGTLNYLAALMQLHPDPSKIAEVDEPTD